jgi:hypothetical protein
MLTSCKSDVHALRMQGMSRFEQEFRQQCAMARGANSFGLDR